MACGFLAPALVILGVFLLVPAVWVLGLSLFRWDLIGNNPGFIGLGNYARMARDSLWWQTLAQTLYYVAVTVPVGTALGLLFAVLLNARLRGRGLLRAMLFSPYITPVVATVIVWAWIYNDQYGVLNSVLTAARLHDVGWLTDSAAVMPAIILYSVWQQTGYVTVIFLAGLSNIPAEMDEAARADGARPWQVFRHVTWPLLTPTTYFVLLISLINSFKVFTPVFVFFGGFAGPNNAAGTIGWYLYRQAFAFFRAGYASAISVALFAIILLVTLIQMRVSRNRVFYR